MYLFYIFFKVGLFSIGGGLAAIPLIQSEVVERGWITLAQFSDMIAVSESTPGPIGVNVATYVGFSQYGILGGTSKEFRGVRWELVEQAKFWGNFRELARNYENFRELDKNYEKIILR